MQSMQNLPGVTVQDGKVQLRGNDKVTVLIDGKQTALTGFGSQSGLDNIPASATDNLAILYIAFSKYDKKKKKKKKKKKIKKKKKKKKKTT